MTVQRVSPQEADRLVREEDYVYLDVRSVPEFEAGHPPDAYNVPIMHKTAAGMEPNDDFMEVVTAVFERDTKLVIGCRSGNRSLRAAQLLLADGYEYVVDQRAGLAGARNAFGQLEEPGWEAAGLDMATEPHPERHYGALLLRRNG